MQRLLLVLLVTMPIALAVSLASGWFLAGRALRPVDAITLAAQRIAAGDLSQRLTVSTSPDEIGRLAHTFNDMIGRLDASFRQIRQFSSDASHELDTADGHERRDRTGAPAASPSSPTINQCSKATWKKSTGGRTSSMNCSFSPGPTWAK